MASTEVQAQEIVNMRLYQLTGMERERLEKEFQELDRSDQRIKSNSFRQKPPSSCYQTGNSGDCGEIRR